MLLRFAIVLCLAASPAWAECYQRPLRGAGAYDGDTLYITMPGLPDELTRMTVRLRGVDTPERDQLLAANHDVEAMREIIGADSLAYISIDGLYRAMGLPGRDPVAPQYCDACFSGEYPVRLTDRLGGNGAKQLSLLAESA